MTLSPLELHAQKVAETAVAWAHQQTGGKVPAWSDMDETTQMIMTRTALSHVAMQWAAQRVPFEEVVQ